MFIGVYSDEVRQDVKTFERMGDLVQYLGIGPDAVISGSKDRVQLNRRLQAASIDEMPSKASGPPRCHLRPTASHRFHSTRTAGALHYLLSVSTITHWPADLLMRIKKLHSLSAGLEASTANGSLAVVEDALRLVDLDNLEKKVSRERGRIGELLWSPISINGAFESHMETAGWQEYTSNYFVCEDFEINRLANQLPYLEQAAFIRAAGFDAYRSNTQSDFLRDGTVIEMQLGKYAFVSYDIMVKNSILRYAGLVQCAIEIVPMKELQAQMSSGPSYFEHVSDKFSKMHPDDLPRLPTLILGIC